LGTRRSNLDVIFKLNAATLLVNDFTKPYAFQYQGSWLARRILALMGWRVQFEGFPTLQGVAVVYPHTSNWDFPVMVLVKWAIGVQVMFWGKDKLFDVPVLGAWMRWIGGVPVNRTAPGGVVGQAVQIFEAHKAANKYLWLGLAPEGTRKQIPGWRSGFYRTAYQSKVPLCIVKLDYKKREVSATDFVMLTGDETQDMARIATIYQGVQGLYPELAAPVQMLDPKIARQDTVVK
jgi:1-acyl-sn-glycerol-3-phosphate acyltransferase